MTPTNPIDGIIKTSGTVFDVIELLMESDGATVTEVAERLDVAKSTAHRHLKSIEQRGYLVRRGDEYDLSYRFLQFSEYVSHTREGDALVRQVVDELAEKSGEHAQFFVEEHGWAVYVYGQGGEQAVYSGPGLGNTVHLHATAAGKSLLAHMLTEFVERSLERDLPALTENTLTEEGALRQELEAVRERGYALNREENIEGLRAVGVPVFDPDNNLFGALSISGPTRRMHGQRFREELPEHLLGRANELELNIELAREGDDGDRRQ